MFSPLTKQLIESLRCLPGVGPKTAQRMAFQLLNQPGRVSGQHLATTLHQALSHIQRCHCCQNFSENPQCDLCANPKRQTELLCIVEQPQDIIAIEASHAFPGRYFVLHGHLSPLDNIGPEELQLPLLFQQIEENGINEVIIATNSTMEGEATAHYIANHFSNSKVQCSRLAHGVPMGGELEYLDGNTLTHAFKSRVLLTTE